MPNKRRKPVAHVFEVPQRFSSDLLFFRNIFWRKEREVLSFSLMVPLRVTLYFDGFGVVFLLYRMPKLTCFMPLPSFYTPLRTSENPGGIEREQWHEMG